MPRRVVFFFFNDTATTEIYTLSLHDALPIWTLLRSSTRWPPAAIVPCTPTSADRKSTRLNSSHANISYAVFCLKKKKTTLTSMLNITTCQRDLQYPILKYVHPLFIIRYTLL